MRITTRTIGCSAVVELEFGPQNKQKVNLGTYWKNGLLRLAQEIEHDLDYMLDVANKMDEQRNNKENAE